MSDDPYDSELETREIKFDKNDDDDESNIETGEMSNGEPQAQGFNTDHTDGVKMRRVSVRALPFRRVGFLPPSNYLLHIKHPT